MDETHCALCGEEIRRGITIWKLSFGPCHPECVREDQDAYNEWKELEKVSP